MLLIFKNFNMKLNKYYNTTLLVVVVVVGELRKTIKNIIIYIQREKRARNNHKGFYIADKINIKLLIILVVFGCCVFFC